MEDAGSRIQKHMGRMQMEIRRLWGSQADGVGWTFVCPIRLGGIELD